MPLAWTALVTVAVAFVGWVEPSWAEQLQLTWAIASLPVIFGSLLFAFNDHRKNLQLYEAARRDEENLQAQGLIARTRSIEALAARAVQDFEALPQELQAAISSESDALHHFRNEAFSPFWQSIESALSHLANYRSRILQIQRDSEDYGRRIEEYRALGGLQEFAAFPIDVDDVGATEVATRVSDRLNRAAYEAQRHPVFAQIWEQRRTTAAIVVGFASLEVAIRDMTAAMTSSIRSLSTTVRNIEAELRSGGATRATAAEAQLEAQRDLNANVSRVVWYLKQADNRDIGWRF